MFKEARIQEIQAMLEKKDFVSVLDLQQHFEVSDMTIRRDLMVLEKRGEIVRFHGGARRSPKNRNRVEPPIIERMNQYAEEKKRIAVAVAGLIDEGDVVFLGTGTTILYLAREIIIRDDITVATNSVPILHELATNSNMKVITVGGVLRRSELSMIGAFAEPVLKNIRVNKVIIGMRGIHPLYGFTCEDPEELITDRKILEISDHIYVVADHTKMGQVATNRVAPLEAAEKIITTKDANEDMVRNIRTRKVEVILA